MQKTNRASGFTPEAPVNNAMNIDSIISLSENNIYIKEPRIDYNKNQVYAFKSCESRVGQLMASAIRMSDIGDDETPNWLIKGLLSQGDLSVVYGPSGAGKSFIVLDAAIHIASGKDWFGQKVLQGAVAYFALEGASGVKKRLRAYRQHYSGAMESDAFVLFPTPIDLCSTESDAEAIAEAAMWLAEETGQPLRLIVFDTLNRAMAGGDENGPKDMGALIANADRIREATGAHVLIVHHSGKNAENGARGHSSLRAAVDTELEVSAPKKTNVRRLQVSKQKDGPEDVSISFKLETVVIGQDEDGANIGSCVVVPANSLTLTTDYKSNNSTKKPAHTENALDALSAIVKDDIHPEGLVNHDKWRDNFYTLHCNGMKGSTERSAFSRAKKWLMDNDFISIDGDSVALINQEVVQL